MDEKSLRSLRAEILELDVAVVRADSESFWEAEVSEVELV